MISFYQNTYRLCWWFLTPFLFYYLYKRSKKNDAYWHHKSERFGCFKQTKTTIDYWLHGVSLGEIRAATALIIKLCKQNKSILITNMTPTGRAESLKLQKLYPQIQVCYLPYEHCVHQVIKVFNPQCLLVMETECWPRMLYVARHIPRYLINARLSEKSQKSYQKIQKISTWMFMQFDKIMVQSITDKQRFSIFTTGDNTDNDTKFPIIGNLKFDFPLNELQIKQGELLKYQWQNSHRLNRNENKNKKIISLISTRNHEGVQEEALILSQLMQQFDDYLWLIIPRHPERFELVFNLITQQFSQNIIKKSQLNVNDIRQNFILGDSLGEMSFYLAMTDIAIIGGSFVPLGAQNVIEPCLQKTPVIVGPSSFNFSESVRLGVQQQAIKQVTLQELEQTIKELTQDNNYKKAQQAAFNYAQNYQGATKKVIDLLS